MGQLIPDRFFWARGEEDDETAEPETPEAPKNDAP
jgi:hypothetical protein